VLAALIAPVPVVCPCWVRIAHVKSCRSAVSVFVVVVGLLGLSACSDETSSGLATFSPSARTGGSPSSARASRWTAEQQQVIDNYDGFTAQLAAIWSKAEVIDMAKVHKVAKEPFATSTMKSIDATLSIGLVRTGHVVDTIAAVTVDGNKATIKTCYDQTHTKYSSSGKASLPPVQILPPSKATVTLAREGSSWLVTDFKGGQGPCVTG